MSVTGEETPLLDGSVPSIPAAPFTAALVQKDGSRLPQAIAHRGDKSTYPENTIAAFKSAIKLGVHAVETDLHLTKDKVVVLSHDATLKRCFGIDKKLADCDWEYVETLRTTREPHEPMPRLSDLLELLAEPGNEKLWVLLDIKRDDNKDELLRRTAETIESVTPSRPWKERILMGCWSAAYMKVCKQYLDGFPITYIGFSVLFARSFLKVPNINFNIFQKVLVGPLGRSFIKDAKAAGRTLLVWTVNEEEWMEWSIRKELDGVITDFPEKYLEICKRHQAVTAADKESAQLTSKAVVPAQRRGIRRWTRLYLNLAAFNLMTTIFTGIMIAMLGLPSTQVKKSLLTAKAA